MDEGQWNYLKFLMRVERVVEPAAEMTVVIMSVVAAWRALTGHLAGAVIMTVLVAALMLALRWDPPLIKWHGEEFGTDD